MQIIANQKKKERKKKEEKKKRKRKKGTHIAKMKIKFKHFLQIRSDYNKTKQKNK